MNVCFTWCQPSSPLPFQSSRLALKSFLLNPFKIKRICIRNYQEIINICSIASKNDHPRQQFPPKHKRWGAAGVRARTNVNAKKEREQGAEPQQALTRGMECPHPPPPPPTHQREPTHPLPLAKTNPTPIPPTRLLVLPFTFLKKVDCIQPQSRFERSLEGWWLPIWVCWRLI